MRSDKGDTSDKSEPSAFIKEIVAENRKIFKKAPTLGVASFLKKLNTLFGLNLPAIDVSSWDLLYLTSTEELDALASLLKEIAPYLKLVSQIADLYSYQAKINPDLPRRLTDEAILKMIGNFEKINRSGRSSQFGSGFYHEKWAEFASKHAKVIAYCQDVPNLKTMREFKNALKGISKENLLSCHVQWLTFFADIDASERTFYRHKLTDLLKFKKLLPYLEHAIDEYDNLTKI